MSEQEKISLMEEIMDVDPGTLELDAKLSDYTEWDSLSMLSYISEVSDNFGKTLTGKDVKAFETVRDAINAME